MKIFINAGKLYASGIAEMLNSTSKVWTNRPRTGAGLAFSMPFIS
jgi:hypothetical protein